MPRAEALEKGKQVEKMKRHIAQMGLVVAALVMLGWHPVKADEHETVIVAFGDSLTAGYGLPRNQSFPAQLQAALQARGANVRIVNAGVSGDTAHAGLKRLHWSLPENADAVIVELGANDALQGLPPEEAKRALAKIIEQLQAKDLKVLLTGMEAPRNMGKAYVAAFGAIYPDLAARYDVALYPFFLEGAALSVGLMQPDGIHPNGKGVAKIVENMLPSVEKLLAQSRAESDLPPDGKTVYDTD